MAVVNIFKRMFIVLINSVIVTPIVLAQIGGPQEYVPLTLFQVLARADVVAHVKVIDGSGRYAIVEVIETIAGADPGPRLRIDFRDLNLSLRGQEAVVFTTGEEDLLFLQRPIWKKPSAKNADIYALFHGRRGRLALPPEGGGVFIDAIRRMSALRRREPSDQVEGLRQLLGLDNPLLREAALDELGRLESMTSADLPRLMQFLALPSADLRRHSLRNIRTILSSIGGDDPGEDERHAVEAVRDISRNDPDENVRAEAVRALGAWPRHADLLSDLRAIAGTDPAQIVRYEAKRVLYIWGAGSAN